MATDLALSVKIGAATGGLMSALGGVRSTLGQLGRATDQLKSQTSGLGSAIQRHMGTLAATTLSHLNSRYERLGHTIKQLSDKQKRLNELQQRGETLAAGRAELGGAMMETVAIGATAVVPVKLAIDFESAMADVKKVVDFDTPDGFTRLGDEILRMTRTLPLAATELAAIAASGGQLGIKSADLPKFTETVAKMATAFDMPAEAAGDAMAKLANVYQIPIGSIGRLGDAINQLSNESPAKASDIVNALGRVGGVAKNFGLTELQTASLANAFIALGKPPEVAATAINGMLTKLGTADKQGPKFQQALASMGMSAAGLKKAIKQDAEGALTGFLAKLEKVPADQRMGLLVDMFGLEYADDVAVLAGATKTYADSIDTLNKKGKDGKKTFEGSMEKEFAARAATTANNLQLLKNGLSEIGINIGAAVLPALNSLVNDIRPVITQFATWAKANPAVVSGLVTLVAGFAAFRLATLAGSYAFSLMGSGVNGVMKGFHALHGKGLLIKAMWQGGFSMAKALQVLGMGAEQAGKVAGVFARIGAAAGRMKMAIGNALMRAGQLVRTWGIQLGSSLRQATTRALGVLQQWGMRAVGVLRQFAGMAMRLGRVLGSHLLTALRLAGQAVMTLGRIILTNPVGLAITAIALGAYLIYRHWGTIKPWFINLWHGIKQSMATAWGWMRGKIASFTRFFLPVFRSISALPGAFLKLGGDIVNGLVNGIKAKLAAARDSIVSFGSSIKGWFTSTLGIKSPSRVFMGFGDNIAQGAALGVTRSSAVAGKAVAGMALATATAWGTPSLSVPRVDAPRGSVEMSIEKPIHQVLPPFEAEQPRGLQQSVRQVFEPIRLPQLMPVVQPVHQVPRPFEAEQPQGLQQSVRQVFEPVRLPRPMPVVQPIHQVSQSTATAKANLAQEVTQANRSAMEGPRDRGNAGTGKGMVIHFSPQITIQGGDLAAIRGQVNQAMQLSFAEFERMMKRYEHEKGRTTYGRNA